MATLEQGFEDKLRSAIVADIEAKTVDEPNNLAFRFMQRIIGNLREFGARHDIDVEPVIEHIHIEQVQRTPNGVRVRILNDHEAAAIFEVGATPHTIRGNPTLSFVWEDPPQWVREEFDRARGSGGQFESGWRVFLPSVEHPGVPASRAFRDAIEWLRGELA